VRQLVVVGDTLLDRDIDGAVERLCPDAPVPVVDERAVQVRAGGAGLAACLAAADGHPVTLVTALAGDRGGEELRRALQSAGVSVVDLGLDGPTPEKVRITSGGRSLLRLDRGGGRPGAAGGRARAAVEWASAVLVSDYGRGVAAEPSVRRALDAAVAAGAPVVWDPHPRGATPVAGVTVVTPNLREAEALCPPQTAPPGPLRAAALATGLARRWSAGTVCVTCGASGAIACGADGAPFAAAARAVAGQDACGAGDRFAATLAGALADGVRVDDGVLIAVEAASRFVAAGGAMSGLEPAPEEPRDVDAVLAATRAAGGTVVATGGCFDLLHPGHVRTLEVSRALGDCLIVLLNSDASVARLKGPGRPLVRGADRAAILRALRCVDAVHVFDEDTPERALERLRPDVWTKGGDYRVGDLPEARLLRRWGAEAVVLPYLPDRSTTRLIEEARLHAL
jgi:D-beta-D-heptose 7-phosphate kinase / D-beta-D-heptose 1-phosphate adenosyltransferase